MPYLLDSDECIYALAGHPEAIALIDQLLGDGCAISSITYMEVYQGVVRTPNPDEAGAQLAQFLAGIRIIPIDMAVAERCAILRQQLKEQGRRVNSRALDLLNAATALTYNLVLVTNNTEDYEDVPGLEVYRSETKSEQAQPPTESQSSQHP
jgi:predicted nucleic acid-binding protein